MTTPLTEYERRIEGGALAPDAEQRRAVEALERLHAALLERGAPARGWRRRLAARLGRRPAPVRGVYMHGHVGRGKTLLMDLFFHSLPFEDKMRRHFHRFMAGVHDELKRHRDKQNPLDHVAEGIADSTRVICFDELAVDDIADAMILGSLFRALFDRGVTLAATSNIAPRDLYSGGLQRERFKPAIGLIERHTEVVRVGGEHDYRLDVLERADVFQCPADAAAEERLARFFEDIAPDAGDTDGAIELFGREIPYRRCADGVIWFDFASLCDGPRSQDDYIELSRLFQTVIVSGVPRLDRTRENQARRFIALVDEFYDRRVKLILSADTEIAELYQGQRLQQEFVRTRSRLEEMQTHDYLAAAHLT